MTDPHTPGGFSNHDWGFGFHKPRPSLGGGEEIMSASTPGLRQRRLDEASAFFEQGHFDHAERSCRLLLSANPADGAALRQMARIELARGAFQDALSVLKRITDIKPDEGWLHVALGTATEMTGNPRIAITHYEQARAAGESSAQVTAFLANALSKCGRSSEAVNLVLAAMIDWPHSVELCIALGDALMAQDQPQDALDAFERPLNARFPAAPGLWAEVHFKIANVLRDLGHVDVAREHQALAEQAMHQARR
jgi:predicted Zn-dependent protease